MATEARVLANRYELGDEIGRGGMARVHIAVDRLLERTVAVKVLSTLDAHDDTAVERFRREAQAVARLNHPNIVAVYDWGEDDDTAFIVMEYVDGQTLREVLYDRGRLTPLESATVAAEIADALAFAHDNGVVHRDVKPGNVLITPNAEVKVTDFGIARADSSDALTRTGSVMGTATYFSPEQAQGLALDGRSDVYSLGVVLYEMVTGAPPFTADSPVSVAYKHVREDPHPPSEVAPNIPGSMDRIVLTAMAKDVDARYQSADELRADLLRFERGRPLVGGPAIATVVPEHENFVVEAPVEPAGRRGQAPPPVPVQSARRRSGNRWAAIVAIGTAFALLFALIVVLLANSDIGGDEAPTVELAGVPTVVGQAYDAAVAQLQQAGFAVERVDEARDDVNANIVLRQDPEEGRKVKKGATVVLTVASDSITVPDLVGKTRSEAQAILTSKRLAGRFDEVDSDKPAGIVLSQDPPSGGTVPKSFPAVVVTIAREPAVAIPDVANLDVTPAAATLGAAGFTVSNRDEFSDTVPVGKVIGTDPAAGTLVPRGSGVALLVSKGQEARDIPNTVGQTEADATNTLLGAGFGVNISRQTVADPSKRGIVISQSPAGGPAPRLTSVTIIVGQ